MAQKKILKVHLASIGELQTKLATSVKMVEEYDSLVGKIMNNSANAYNLLSKLEQNIIQIEDELDKIYDTLKALGVDASKSPEISDIAQKLETKLPSLNLIATAQKDLESSVELTTFG